MTAMPVPSHEPTTPDHPLTIGEYAALGETKSGYTELIEGSLLMSPSPAPSHNIASGELFVQIRHQLPAQLRAIQDVDVDLELAPRSEPGFSRRPDLIVVTRDTVRRVDSEGGLIRASEVLVVVEIVSPSSRRIDKINKRGEYEDAGIPWYWIVDISDPISLVACFNTKEFGYQDHQRVKGTFTSDEPFPVMLDLDRLR